MSESTRASEERASRVREFNSTILGFDVVDRNGERVGSVDGVSLGRTCIVVGGSREGLFGRKQRHHIHVWAVREIDLDTFMIFLASTKEDVVEAPEFHELDEECETSLGRYYYDRLVALGEKVERNDES